MTTSGQARKARAQQPADPSAAGASNTAAAGDPRHTAAQAASEPAAPGDEQELKAEIEQTREQLGQTVEQLAAKTDLKARARAKAAGLTGSVKSTTAQVRAKAAGQGATVRRQVAGTTVMARQKAIAGTNQLRTRVAPAWQKVPESVRRTVTRGTSTAKQHKGSLAVAAASLVASYLALRWWRKR
jgi:hypothetical protein